MGEVLLRIAGTLLISKHLGSLRQHFDRRQFALEKNGAETIVHAVRKRVREDDDVCVVALDCANAFNTLNRDAIKKALAGQFSGMRGFFKTAYSKPSRLLLRSGDSWKIIDSSHGGKQGDSAMPAFFSLAIHSAIEGNHTGVDVFAFMDDITIVGNAKLAGPVIKEIEQKLADVGLKLNRKKCEVYGTGSKELADAFSFSRNESGIKILGAWIARDEHRAATKAFLKKQLAKHLEMLEKLPPLDPDVAFPLLQSCAVPRWNFLVRTHEPADTAEATELFDQAVLQAFCRIARVSGLTQSQKDMLHLPTRMGGFGLTRYSLIAKGAYEASRDTASDCQEVRTQAVHEKLLASLSKDLQKHLGKCCQRHASSWLNATDCETKNQNGYVGALQLRLRWHPPVSKTKVKCPCGYFTTPDELESHAAGCRGPRGNDLTDRHREMQIELNRLAKECGVPCTLEPTLEGLKRADAELILLEGPLLVDFTVCNESAPSYAKLSSEQLQSKVDAKKQAHYKNGHDGVPLKTFYLDTLGGWSNDAIGVIKALVREGSSFSTHQAIRRIAKATMMKTGMMVLKARRAYTDDVEVLRPINPSTSRPATPHPLSSIPVPDDDEFPEIEALRPTTPAQKENGDHKIQHKSTTLTSFGEQKIQHNITTATTTRKEKTPNTAHIKTPTRSETNKLSASKKSTSPCIKKTPTERTPARKSRSDAALSSPMRPQPLHFGCPSGVGPSPGKTQLQREGETSSKNTPRSSPFSVDVSVSRPHSNSNREQIGRAHV